MVQSYRNASPQGLLPHERYTHKKNSVRTCKHRIVIFQERFHMSSLIGMSDIAESYNEEVFIPIVPNKCLQGIRRDFRAAQRKCNAHGHYSLTITPQRFTVHRKDQSAIFVDIREPGCPNSKLLYVYYRIVAEEPEFRGIRIDFRYLITDTIIGGKKRSVKMMVLTFRVPQYNIAK